MDDYMTCPFCGGTITISAQWDRGDCDTCGAHYQEGFVTLIDESEEVQCALVRAN